MKRNLAMILVTLMLVGLAVSCGGDDEGAGKSGLGESCTKTDDCESVLKCLDMKCVQDEDTTDGDDSTVDGDEITATGEPWYDSSSGLTWQNPPAGEEMNWDDAKKYCDNLDLSGHTDWRLPTIDELRSLVRGCPATEAGGSCNIQDGGCLAYSCRDDSCYDTGCSSGEGPADGCFWPGDLEGKCSWYWSSSAVADVDYLAWDVNFSLGGVSNGLVGNDLHVRCVR